MLQMRFSALILAIALTGTPVLGCAYAEDVPAQGPGRGAADQKVRTMKIRVDVEGRAVTATLDDNETARDFVSLLPLTLTLKDYAETEKISDLPRRLSTKGAPPGIDPSIGDITYYSPWGNLALFYKKGHYSNGLVKLGRIDAGREALNRPGPLRVRVELVEREQSP
jgi:hypothetical protein